MKSTGTSLWLSPNTGATNSSGFTGLPGGNRGYNGVFGSLGISSSWWSSSVYTLDPEALYLSFVAYNNGNATSSASNKKLGTFVRCIKD